MRQTSFQKIIAQLEKTYGRPQPPQTSDPLEMILFENVAYLVSDERRERAFNALRDQIGLKPTDILSAPSDKLLEVARMGGMRPEDRADKLQFIARTVLSEFQGDLGQILKWPVARAKKALKKFPGIGDPGAEKILLFSRAHPILALESNGLRALIRLGFGEELKNYAATYRSAQEAVKDQLTSDSIEDYVWLICAHLLLRRHGQELCKRTEPICTSCPLTENCRYWRDNSSMLSRGKIGAKPPPKK
jgi:endonuclease III